MSSLTETAIFGGGCFWCTEAVFNSLRGVTSVEPGYSGGTVPNPTYEQVSGGTTGHAEAIKIEFNPDEISFRDLLTVFFGTHNPTTPNQQGADHGPQYRSAIFCTTEQQRAEARAFIDELTTSGEVGAPIVTEVEHFTGFFPAEDYHRRYYERNKGASYCQVVIDPKLAKLREHFSPLLKKQ